MAWTADDIDIELDDDGTDDPVVTASIRCPAGLFLVMAEPVQTVSAKGRCLELHGLHMQSETLEANPLGATRLLWLVRAVMEALNLDEIIVCGATRTTGANPGRRPREFRFARPSRPAP